MIDPELQDGLQKLKAALDERDALRAEVAALKSTVDELRSRTLDPNALRALADLIVRAAAA